ncbi:CD63 antigen-like [Anoplophora glabripennis]|uniref:CD63 antigen-like n=1 Tax=Anoplophora glabripennis TaxID=217634 RepID=UPI0008758CE3|nr:CD63 antigen-like [Anoplophora glabripennis]
MAKQAELEVGMKCVKYMLFVANFMFVLVGFLLISIGTTIKAIYGDFEVFMENHYYSAAKLAIAIGVIIFFVALFGCVGAVKESVCLVNTYAFFLFCVLILEVSVSIAAYVMRGNLESTLKRNMLNSLQYNESYTTQYTWNATQYNLRCCGVTGPSDWSDVSDLYDLNTVVGTDNTTIFLVPDTCCINESCTSEDSIYEFGCLNRITYIVSECALLLAVGALCVSFIQILGIIFSHLLARSIRRLKTQMAVEKMERRQHIYEQLAKSGQSEKVSPVLYTPTSSEA